MVVPDGTLLLTGTTLDVDVCIVELTGGVTELVIASGVDELEIDTRRDEDVEDTVPGKEELGKLEGARYSGTDEETRLEVGTSFPPGANAPEDAAGVTDERGPTLLDDTGIFC